MDHLHAYWRMEYIKAPDAEKIRGNPFVELPKLSDEAALIVKRSTHNYIVLNKFPYNAGHLLVIPFREVPELDELTADERADHFEMIIQAKAILNRALNPHGFNIGYNFGCAAGAGIPTHLHCHLVPRWDGDTNFMPVLGETRVLPEALKTMWKRLHECA